MSGAERTVILRNKGDEIDASTYVLAKMKVQENGKPLPEAVWNIEDTVGVFHFYAGLAERLDNRSEQEIALGMKGVHVQSGERTSWRCRCNHSVEFPDAHGGVEGRPGTGSRVHHGAETLGTNALHRVGTG